MNKQNKTLIFLKKQFKSWWSFIVIILAVILIRSTIFDNFVVPSGSMKPSLLIGDRIVISKMSYGYSKHSFPFGLAPIKERVFFKEPQRGDVIIFKIPRDGRKINYVKRLIGLPGDAIQMRNGELYINQEKVQREYIKDIIDEQVINKKENIKITRAAKVYKETLDNGVSYLTQDTIENSITDNTREYLVPQDHYFFMGDNRDNSQDSRFLNSIGFVNKKYLMGKVKIILFSAENPSNLFFLNPFDWLDVRGSRFWSKDFNWFSN